MKYKNVFGIVGWKNSGKTTLVESLVKYITVQGYQVSTIKHAHHSFDIDHEGTDSFKHRKAGAKEVLLASRKRWALIHELIDEPEKDFDFHWDLFNGHAEPHFQMYRNKSIKNFEETKKTYSDFHADDFAFCDMVFDPESGL